MRFFEEVEDKYKVFPGVETIKPKRADDGSACYDFYVKEDIVLNPGEKHLTFTDIRAFFAPTEVLLMFVRSSTGIKLDTILSNTTAVIDSSHYGNKSNGGNIGISLRNIGTERIMIEKGQRVAQGLFTFALITNDDETLNIDRLGPGIGSSGKF